jgi:hypothetical protein
MGNSVLLGIGATGQVANMLQVFNYGVYIDRDSPYEAGSELHSSTGLFKRGE